jgi:hypothetical protein
VQTKYGTKLKDSFITSRKSIYFLIALLSCLTLLVYDFYRLNLPSYLEYWLGGSAYVIFWSYFFLFFFHNKTKANRVFLIVLLLTILIEFSQSFHPLWLDKIREIKAVYAVIGHQFSWYDFPPYFLGTAFCFFLENLIRQKSYP